MADQRERGLSYIAVCIAVCSVGVQGFILDTDYDVHIYVSTIGSDTNTGMSWRSPFATIQKAVSMVMSPTLQDRDIFVELMQGYHDLSTTLHVQHTNNNQLVFRPYTGSEVHVTGGRRLDVTKFRPVTDPRILARLPAIATKHVKVYHLPDANITDYGSIRRYGASRARTAPLEIFFNGQPLTLAKWPNKGYINIVGVTDGKDGRRFEYNSSRPSSWKQEPEIWAYGYWYWSWADRAIRIDAINDTSRVISLHEAPSYGLRTGHWDDVSNAQSGYDQQGGYFRVFNVLAELDQPGEYYVDKSSGDLYAWLPAVLPEQTDHGIAHSDTVYVSLINDCISLGNGTRNVILQNFTLEACRARGITGINAHRVHVENMEIRNTGGYSIQLGGDTRDSIISRCNIHHGDGGVSVSGGVRRTLTRASTWVQDNVIWQFSREGAVGYDAVHLSGVGIGVGNNHIYQGQYTAVRYSGNDHLMQYNHIHDVCLAASDCGAIHTGRDWTSRGNSVRHNLVHHILRLVPGADVRGVMLDDQASGTFIEYNTFHDNQVHVNIGGGRDNVVANNVFYNATSYAMQVDGRGVGRKNDATLYKRLHSVPYTSSLWTTQYPAMAHTDSQNLSLPEGNQIVRNLVYNVAGREFVHGLSHSIDKVTMFNLSQNGMAIGDMDFENVSLYDYRVRCHADRWAIRVGFVDTPSPNQVGPYYSAGQPHKPIVPQKVAVGNHMDPCTTHAPAHSPPVTSYLPDGSSTNTLYNVDPAGCWLSVSACPTNPSLTGLHRETGGELHTDASVNETTCLARAAVTWRICGHPPDVQVAAIYGQSGAMTIAGDGCFFAMYDCPKHSGNTDGHVTPGKFIRDSWAERHVNAANDEAMCLSRALAQWHYCGSYSAIRTAGAGCWIHVQKCPNHHEVKAMFYDAWGATNLQTDDNKSVCFNRAEYYWSYCGSHDNLPVTAYYRPLAVSHTVPI